MSPSAIIDSEASSELIRTKQLPRQDTLDLENRKLWDSKHLLVAIFMFFSNFYMFMLRGNLSIAIVEMTSEKNITIEDKTIVQMPEFEWDSKTKGWVLSLLSYGGFFAPVGGYLSTKYGGVSVNGIGILLTAILTLISPWALRTNIYLFGVGRIAEGVFEGFAYASTCDIWSRWIPKSKLPSIISFSYTGYQVGAAVTYPICGFIAQYLGWPMIFYMSGTFALIWSVSFLYWVRNDPSEDKKISPQELQYLKQNTSVELIDRKTITFPWRKIITSKAIWSFCINKIAYSWAQMAFLLCFPLYIKDITKKSTSEVGLYSCIPNVVNLIVAPISGILIEYLQNNLGFDPSKLQKWALVVGFLLTGILFVIVGYSDFTISMMCFVLIVILLSINVTILQWVAVGMSPNHAALIAGIGAFWFSLSSVVAPVTIGYVVVNHTRQEWGICFVLSGCVMVFAAAITALFGSSDDQNWILVNEGENFDTKTIKIEQKTLRL